MTQTITPDQSAALFRHVLLGEQPTGVTADAAREFRSDLLSSGPTIVAGYVEVAAILDGREMTEEETLAAATRLLDRVERLVPSDFPAA